MKTKKAKTTTLGQLEKAIKTLGSEVGVEVEDDFFRAEDDETIGEGAGEGEASPEKKEEKKTPPPPPKKKEMPEKPDEEDADDEEDEEPDEEEEDDEEDEDEGDGEKPEKEDDEEKSLSDDLAKSFTDNANIEKAIDVSEFLDALTVQTVDALEGVRSVVRKSLKESRSFRRAEFNVLAGQALLTKSLVKQIKTLSTRLDEISTQPQMRKSVTSGAQPLQRAVGQAAPGKTAGNSGEVGTPFAKSLDAQGNTKSFTTEKELVDDMVDRLTKCADPMGPLAKSLAGAITAIEGHSIDPEFPQQLKSLGYLLD